MEMDNDKSGDGRERSLSSILKEKGKAKATKTRWRGRKPTPPLSSSTSRQRRRVSVVEHLLLTLHLHAMTTAPQPVLLNQRGASRRPKPNLHRICCRKRNWKRSSNVRKRSRNLVKWEPSKQEWGLFELIEPLLYAFACVTNAFSATSYPTSNIFYPHIVSIKKELTKAMVHQNKVSNDMGHKMMEKFNKYWEDTSNVMVIATFLDPRYKMKYVQWCF